MKFKIILSMIIILLLLSSCTTQLKNPKRGTKTTIDYNNETNDKKIIVEPSVLNLKSNNLSITISPIRNSTVNSMILINVNSFPNKTEKILVFIYPKNSTNPIEDNNSLINYIEAPFESEFGIEIKDLKNGEYSMTIAATYKNAPEDDPWIEVLKKDIKIQN